VLLAQLPGASEQVNDPQADSTEFVCWFRRHRFQVWRQVGTAGTEAEAWALLLRHDPGDKCVLPKGRHPADPLGHKGEVDEQGCH
jgi:hypothetical protein